MHSDTLAEVEPVYTKRKRDVGFIIHDVLDGTAVSLNTDTAQNVLSVLTLKSLHFKVIIIC